MQVCNWSLSRYRVNHLVSLKVTRAVYVMHVTVDWASAVWDALVHRRSRSQHRPVDQGGCCRCLGDPQFKEKDKDVVDCTPEMRRVELQPGDFAIALASDGLWDVLSDTEVVTVLQKVRPSSHQPCFRRRRRKSRLILRPSCHSYHMHRKTQGIVTHSLCLASTGARRPAQIATEAFQLMFWIQTANKSMLRAGARAEGGHQ